MTVLDELRQEKELLEQAVYRKGEIRSILKPLLKQYDAIKKEIEARKKRAERLIKEYKHPPKETQAYSEYLDTIRLEDSDLEFPRRKV